MRQENKVNRRRFLTAAGAAVAGISAGNTPTPSASAQSPLIVRKQAAIPYKPDVLCLVRGLIADFETDQHHGVGKEIGKGVDRICYQGLTAAEYPGN